MRILIVAPPYRPPHEGNLAIATLAPILRDAGHEVVELFGSLDYPRDPTHPAPAMLNWSAQHAFGRLITTDSVDDHVDTVVAAMSSALDAHEVVAPRDRLWSVYGVDEEFVRGDVRAQLIAAEACLDRMVDRAIALGPVDVIACSVMFTDELPAGIAFSRRLRERWPSVKLCVGGAMCFEEQGEGLLATFPEVDAVCVGDGESVVVALVEALCGLRELAKVPGIAWRDSGGIRRNPNATKVPLDSLPIPDYAGFIAAHAESAWADVSPELFFETSRGCWWGVKSLCTFCGLNGDGLGYRTKSPARATAEIRSLYEAYPTARLLRAADNILDMRYLREVMPRLADLASDRARPLRMFYEVKSNLRPDQITALVEGGVAIVQPGIESFSDDALQLMRKGNTALGQVQFVKWSAEAGLHLDYNILVLNPGEETSWYHDMVELVPFLEHLPPPQSTIAIVLERFSPYFNATHEFGIANVRMKPYFRAVFGDLVDERLAYKFDYDHPILRDANHLAAVRALVAAVWRWRDSYVPDRAYYTDTDGVVAIHDRRTTPAIKVALHATAARLFRLLDRHQTRESIGTALADVEPSILDASLEVWLHRRWICRVNERYLAVLPHKGRRVFAPVRQPAVRLAVLSA